MRVEHIGQGPELFLIHGWMMNGRCWHDLAARLKDHYRLTIVDLPGHGRSLRSVHSLSRPRQLLDGLLELAPPAAVWIGWSLGGLLAQLSAPLAAERMRALISIGMGARYTAAADWPQGVSRTLFRGVRQLFSAAPAQLTRQLIDQQLLGSERQAPARRVLNTLAAMPWDKRELKAGLKLLDSADARPAIRRLNQPVLFIAGEKDLIVDRASLKQSAALARQGHYTKICGAGHAPFLSHPLECMQIMEGFINELD